MKTKDDGQGFPGEALDDKRFREIRAETRKAGVSYGGIGDDDGDLVEQAGVVPPREAKFARD